ENWARRLMMHSIGDGVVLFTFCKASCNQHRGNCYRLCENGITKSERDRTSSAAKIREALLLNLLIFRMEREEKHYRASVSALSICRLLFS
ncbi:MAG: hypothetical protein AAFW75_00265, partial [Cyanobacteria bacterium J06636_16]